MLYKKRQKSFRCTFWLRALDGDVMYMCAACCFFVLCFPSLFFFVSSRYRFGWECAEIREVFGHFLIFFRFLNFKNLIELKKVFLYEISWPTPETTQYRSAYTSKNVRLTHVFKQFCLSQAKEEKTSERGASS